MALDLDRWNEDMGGPVVDTMFASRNSGFEWKMERGYVVKVTRASIVESQRGDVQLRLALDIYGNEDAERKLGDCLEHLTLPRQETDRNFDKEKVGTMTQRRMQDIQKVLMAAQPAVYKIAERREEIEGRPGQRRYIGFDGKVLTGALYERRRAECNRAADQKTLEWHAAIGSEVEEVVDATFYIVRRANPKSEKYPYLNIYNDKPRGVPMLEEASEGTDVDTVPF